jgi:molybdenum cofactor cytidylyltransferase
MKQKISAILLAAGQSTRMGGPNKLLLKHNGAPLIKHAVQGILASGVHELIVVIGHQGSEIQERVKSPNITFVVNETYETGMTSSIQAGVKQASHESTGYLICLADMPSLDAHDYKIMVEKCLSSVGNKIVRPMFDGQSGHPIFFSKDFRALLLNHRVPEGCRGVIESSKQYLETFHFPNNHILLDIDSPEDFANLSE